MVTREIKHIPIRFNKKQEFKNKDTRFVSVEIVLMHLGENLNGSYFSKDVVERALPTLANTPILAYIETNKNGDEDFSDHRAELSKDKNGNYGYSYRGKAIGLISETNNARFEFRDDGTGTIREYLIVDGLLWTKWDTPLEIFNAKSGVASQSMELHEDAEGYFDSSDGLFHFSKFSFYGACCLGQDVEPAMTGANISYNFTNLEDMKKEISEKMEEFKLSFGKVERSGEVNMSTEKVERAVKLDNSVEETTEEIVVEEVATEGEVVVEAEEDIESVASEFKEEDKDDEDKKDEEDKPKSKKSDKKDSDKEEEDEDEEDKKEKGKKNFESMYSELVEEVEAIKLQLSDYEKENKELKESLSVYQQAEREKAETELFSKYKELDGIQEYETLKTNVSKYECLDSLEKEIALVYVKNKANLSFTKEVKESENVVRFDNTSDSSNDGYGGLLNKYLKK